MSECFSFKEATKTIGGVNRLLHVSRMDEAEKACHCEDFYMYIIVRRVAAVPFLTVTCHISVFVKMT